MDFTPYLRLLWKEYRAIRLFWLCLVGLSIFIQWLATTLAHHLAEVLTPEYCLAMAVPILFALGCAGTIFAIEKEERTFDFLQAIPASSRQLLISKLMLTVLATFAMYFVLWLPALWFTGGALPASETLQTMLWMFPLWAVEAIVWGIFFSLLTARPLLAICLAVAVGGSVTQLLAKFASGPGLDVFAYLQAIPLRIVMIMLILAADVLLGLRWLHGNIRPRLRSRPGTLDLVHPVIPTIHDRVVATDQLLKTPDRGTMMARLFWQHWRQSGRLMMLLAALMVGLPGLWQFVFSDARNPIAFGAEIPLVVMAAIMGAFVFRSDQEGGRFRFFVEHNVPPRYVWFSRQTPWIITLFISTFLSYLVRFEYLSFVLWYKAQQEWLTQHEHWAFNYAAAGIFYGVAGVILSYAAGQWTSMFIRSGLLAGSVAVVFATVVGLWAGLMVALRVNWLWSVAPIPLILLWATWLRAPDWIREKCTWHARFKAAAALLVPTLVLLIAVPLYRVYEIPNVPPGFTPSKYLAEITPEAKATAEFYRHAGEHLSSGEYQRIIRDNPLSIYLSGFQIRSSKIVKDDWLEANANLIPKLLEVSQRGSCAFDDPGAMRTISSRPINLIWLLVASGRQLETKGKLDEALDRYFAALRMVSQFSEYALPMQCVDLKPQAEGILNEFSYWAAAKGQTPERIRGALEQLKEVAPDMLHFEGSLKTEYILQRPQILSDEDALALRYGDSKNAQRAIFTQIIWGKLLPWEIYRQLRELNWMSNAVLFNLTQIKMEFAEDKSMVNWIPDRSHSPERYAFTEYWKYEYEEHSSMAIASLAEFEALRRATMIVLALEAYRLEHAKLPQSLDELAGTYFEQVPVDPFSGTPFVYYPTGIPGPRNPNEEVEFKYLPLQDLSGRPVNLTKPGIWSTSRWLGVQIHTWMTENEQTFEYHDLRENGHKLSLYDALGRGLWYAIPEKQ